MPVKSSEKGRLCAKPSAAQAQQLHGPEGDGCWRGERCYKRRTYYRNRDRYNQRRRRQRRGEVDVLELPAPEAPAVVMYLYRARVGEPLHAMAEGWSETIAADLWLGQQQVAAIAPVHTLGLTGSQVKTYLREILQAFAQYLGQPLEKFESQVELAPTNCQIHPYPLKP